MSRLPTVYIGYDPREQAAYDVCVASILDHASGPVNILPINQTALRRSGLYTRAWDTKDGQKYDLIDGKPFSTEFSFSRFLVPILNQFEGKALFMDCDMFVRSDILELWDVCTNNKPLWCVHHDYAPHDPVKMDGVIQTQYGMKNWSSFMMFNCDHKANARLSTYDVSNKSGNWLHTFQWLKDYYGATSHVLSIGKINEEWNWLDGHSSTDIKPKNVHFTTGGPWFDEWTPSRDTDNIYADKWLSRWNALESEKQIA